VLGTIPVELDTLGMILGHHGIVGADLLDEAAIAWAAGIGHDDAVEGPLLCAAARQSDP
jgi:hypothetical protein